MPELQPQTFETHVRRDPVFLVLAVLSLCLAIGAAIQIAANPFGGTVFRFLEAVCVTGALLLARTYSLKVQDRVIRLEERLRLASLLPAGDAARARNLNESQLIALRFASDSELPDLARRAADENLTSRQIKQAIREWRPDHWRV